MGLITCVDCQNQISDSAVICPHCGRPIGSEAGPKGYLELQRVFQYQAMIMPASITVANKSCKLMNGEIAELTSGTQVRDFMNVEDAGKIIAKITMGSQYGAINVCSGIPVTVREMAEKIAEKYGKRELLKFGTRKDNLIDPDYVVGVPNTN